MRLGLVCRDLPPSVHKPWFYRSAQRYQLARRGLSSNLLFHHYRLPRLATALRRPSTASPLVIRKIRVGDQHRCAALLDAVVVLCFLAIGSTSDRGDDELVLDDVRRCYYLRFGVVLRTGETRLYWTCCRCEARRVEWSLY